MRIMRIACASRNQLQPMLRRCCSRICALDQRDSRHRMSNHPAVSRAAIRGVFVPACTPFDATLGVDEQQFVRHCRWLLDEGAHGLSVFGTTSEANSISAAERM